MSLALAQLLDWDTGLVWVDERYHYSEVRMAALAPILDTLYFVAFVDRGDVRKIVSLRRASRAEVSRYVQAF